MAFGIARMETAANEWRDIGSAPLRANEICHSAVFYWSGLRFIEHNLNAWRLGEPADWNMWRRMKQCGVRIGFVPQVVALHHMEYTRWGT